MSRKADTSISAFSAAVVPRAEVEFADAVLQHGGFFELVEPDALVFRDQYPAVLTNKRQPN
ncbi:MAG: hypothetical protein WAL84_03000 [Candidatus Dormiibacterota bacterium]